MAQDVVEFINTFDALLSAVNEFLSEHPAAYILVAIPVIAILGFVAAACFICFKCFCVADGDDESSRLILCLSEEEVKKILEAEKERTLFAKWKVWFDSGAEDDFFKRPPVGHVHVLSVSAYGLEGLSPSVRRDDRPIVFGPKTYFHVSRQVTEPGGSSRVEEACLTKKQMERRLFPSEGSSLLGSSSSSSSSFRSGSSPASSSGSLFSLPEGKV